MKQKQDKESEIIDYIRYLKYTGIGSSKVKSIQLHETRHPDIKIKKVNKMK